MLFDLYHKMENSRAGEQKPSPVLLSEKKIPSSVSKYVTSQTQNPLNEEEIDPLEERQEERQCNATTSIYGKHSHVLPQRDLRLFIRVKRHWQKGDCQTFQEQLNIGTMVLC